MTSVMCLHFNMQEKDILEEEEEEEVQFLKEVGVNKVFVLRKLIIEFIY